MTEDTIIVTPKFDFSNPVGWNDKALMSIETLIKDARKDYNKLVKELQSCDGSEMKKCLAMKEFVDKHYSIMYVAKIALDGLVEAHGWK